MGAIAEIQNFVELSEGFMSFHYGLTWQLRDDLGSLANKCIDAMRDVKMLRDYSKLCVEKVVRFLRLMESLAKQIYGNMWKERNRLTGFENDYIRALRTVQRIKNFGEDANG